MIALSLPELRQKTVVVFQNKNYQKSCVSRYNNTWDNLHDFMVAHNYAEYSKEIGKQFLEYRFQGIAYNNLTHRQKEVYRHISVLTNMIELGTIRRSVIDKKVYKYPGKIGEPFVAFVQEQAKTKQVSSITRYTGPLQRMYKYLVANNKPVNEIDVKFIINYIKEIETSENAPDKRNVILTIRLFFKYLCVNNLIVDTRENMWMSVLKVPNTSKAKIPSVYTKEEVEKIIAVPDRSSPTGKRDYAMVLLAARYGLRVSDIIGLRFRDLDWENNMIKIYQTKTTHIVSLPLSEEVGTALIEYIKYARPNIDLPYVFISANAPYRNLNSNIISVNISKWMRIAGVNSTNKKMGAHSLRHSLATNLLNANESLPVISEILGHTTTKSTSTYLRISYDQLRQCALDVPFVPSSFYENLYETE